MALIVLGGKLDKKKSLEVLRSMKYYSKDLKIREWMRDEYDGKCGLIPYLMKVAPVKDYEDYIVERMVMIRGILSKSGDEALDAYVEITSPKPDELLDNLRPLDVLAGVGWISEMCDELSTPMTKDQFKHYLEIYNEFYAEG